jgi:hypothetical protein
LRVASRVTSEVIARSTSSCRKEMSGLETIVRVQNPVEMLPRLG